MSILYKKQNLDGNLTESEYKLMHIATVEGDGKASCEWSGLFPDRSKFGNKLDATKESGGGDSGSARRFTPKVLLCLWDLVQFGEEGITLCRDRARELTISLDQARGFPLLVDATADDITTSLLWYHHNTPEALANWESKNLVYNTNTPTPAQQAVLPPMEGREGWI